MGQIVLEVLDSEKVSFACTHYFSYIMEIDERIYRLKGKFFSRYPHTGIYALANRLLWLLASWRRQRTALALAEHAKWRLKPFQPAVCRCQYLRTVWRQGSKNRRHIILVSMSGPDIQRLQAEGMLHQIVIDDMASRHDRVEGAILGLVEHLNLAPAAKQAA